MAGVSSLVIKWFVLEAFLIVLISTLGTFLGWRDDGVGLLEGFTLGWIAVFVLSDWLIGLAVKMPGV